MDLKERQARKRGQQRRRILSAALAIISQNGFAALSMRKLAKRIEYSPASIYLYFEDREQLAQGIRRLGFERLLEQMERGVGKLKGRQALHAMGAAYVSFGREQPELYQVMFMGEPGTMRATYADIPSDPVADRAYQLLLGVTQTLRGIPRRKASCKKVADVIWSSLHGMVSLNLALPGLQSTQPQVQEQLALELMVRGLEQASARKASARVSRKS